jgi:hypothetical protein
MIPAPLKPAASGDWHRNKSQIRVWRVIGRPPPQSAKFFAARRFQWTGDSLDLCVIDHLERSLIEVTTFVGFRIEEETLRATFHGGIEGSGF